MFDLKKKLVVNVKKPQSNIYGKMQLKSMNERHNTLALWGITHMDFDDKNIILDIGCGGGKNILNMLEMKKDIKVYGLDYSEASVAMSTKLNEKAIKSGNTIIKQGTAENIPFDENQFDLVTAFETIYFWDINKGFGDVFRVLKKGGQFMIVNEAQNDDGMEELIATIGFSVYTATQIKTALNAVGFVNITIDEHTNGKWLAVIASK
ncbi:MAG: class I SAM-dependent methyltransferase [Clostridia bacterium]